jgi:hypothetical protein
MEGRDDNITTRREVMKHGENQQETLRRGPSETNTSRNSKKKIRYKIVKDGVTFFGKKLKVRL